jgi:hypothetical protein
MRWLCKHYWGHHAAPAPVHFLAVHLLQQFDQAGLQLLEIVVCVVLDHLVHSASQPREVNPSLQHA